MLDELLNEENAIRDEEDRMYAKGGISSCDGSCDGIISDVPVKVTIVIINTGYREESF